MVEVFDRQGEYPTLLLTKLLNMFCGSNLDYQKKIVCDEVRLITGTISLHVVCGKMELMTLESIIVLRVPWIGSYS